MYCRIGHTRIASEYSLPYEPPSATPADCSYDNVHDPRGHSTFEFAEKTIETWRSFGLPMDRLAVGVPFYGRDVRSGHPETYADLYPLVEKMHPLPPPDSGGSVIDDASKEARDSVDLVGCLLVTPPFCPPLLVCPP